MKKKNDNIQLRANRAVKGFYSPRIVDLLLLYEDFQKAVNTIRNKLKIDPNALDKELGNTIGKKQYIAYKQAQNLIDNADKISVLDTKGKLKQVANLDWESYIKLDQKVKSWEEKRFPELQNEITLLRLHTFNGIPKSWSKPIKQYILYNRKELFFIDNKKPIPEISYKQDAASEAYIEIKIYGDSDISMLNNKKLIKDLQKRLPTYRQIEEGMEENIERRAFYKLLRKRFKLKPKDAANIMQDFGFEPIEHGYTSQELQKLTNLLFNSKKPKK